MGHKYTQLIDFFFNNIKNTTNITQILHKIYTNITQILHIYHSNTTQISLKYYTNIMLILHKYHIIKYIPKLTGLRGILG